MPAKPIPEGHPTIIPHLTVQDGRAAIEFYRKAFGAEQEFTSIMPDGRVLHAQLRIGGGVVFLADPFGPPAGAPGGVTIHIWTADVDALWRRAVAAGAREKMPLMDAFWGDRYGVLEDPFGHSWGLAQRKEDLDEQEMARRAQEWFATMQAQSGG